MTGREGLVPKRMTDKNGRETTVLVNPNKGTKSAGKPSQGAGWATGSPARVSARNRVESAPTPPKPFTALAGLEYTGTTIDDEHDVEWTWNSINRETGTKYDRNGRDQDGFDADGYNRDGFHYSGFDRNGRDRKGRDEFGFLADGTHYSAKTSASKKQLSDFLHSLRSSVADPERVWTDAPRNPETGVSDEAYTYEVTDDAIKVHVERHVFPTDYNLFEPLAEPWAPVIRASEDEGYARKLFANGFEAALDEIEASVHDSVESLVVEGGVAMHPFDMERLWGDRESPFSSATRTREYIADELDVPVADVIASDEELRDLFVVDVDYTFYSLDDGAVELELRKAFKQWEFDDEDGSE